MSLAVVLALVDVVVAHLSNSGMVHWSRLGERIASPVPMFWPLVAAALGLAVWIGRERPVLRTTCCAVVAVLTAVVLVVRVVAV